MILQLHCPQFLLFFIYPVHDWTRDAVLGHLKIMCKQIQEMHVEFSDKCPYQLGNKFPKETISHFLEK